MNEEIIQLFFTTPLHIGKEGVSVEGVEKFVHSDTLFSTICHAWGQMYGKEELDNLIQLFKQTTEEGTEPPFLISSAFPFIWKEKEEKFIFFLPKPKIPPPPQGESTEAKKIQKFVNVLSLESTHPNGWVYSSGRDKKTGRRRGKPFSSYVECLPPQPQPLSLHLSTDAELFQEFTPSTSVRTSLKEFLIQESLRRYGTPVDSQKLIRTILELCQSFTDAAVQREISFLAQLRGVNAVLDFYKKAFYTNPQSVNLDSPSLPLPDKPERPNLRIGWGSGLEEASILSSLPSHPSSPPIRDKVKKLYLDRVWRGWTYYSSSFTTFPKTRRFIVGDGVPPPPTMPLGWVRIEE